MRENNRILIRGAGDIATGTIQKFVRAGYQVLATEAKHPSAIRRHVSLCEAVYEGSWTVEDITAIHAASVSEALEIMNHGKVAILIDPNCECLGEVQPIAVVDAILAKKNIGTNRAMAPITVALGPGFIAGEDVDVVIETMRGHNLGRIINQGSALPNTGVPGLIGGIGKERVLHAPYEGILRNRRAIGDIVTKGEIIAEIESQPIVATIDGILRGLIRDCFPVTVGFKMADIDPRESEKDNCFTISDKARCIGGSVLEAVLMLKNNRNHREHFLQSEGNA